MMPRLAPIIPCLLVGLTLLSQGISWAEKTERPPNIVLIFIDDMGYGDIGVGAADSALIKTPNIDQLAQQGVMLSDFYSPAPVCTPSRTGFLTGRLPARGGLYQVAYPTGSVTEFIASTMLNPGANVRLPSDEITLADVLGAAGYATGGYGASHDQSETLVHEEEADQ